MGQKTLLIDFKTYLGPFRDISQCAVGEADFGGVLSHDSASVQIWVAVTLTQVDLFFLTLMSCAPSDECGSRTGEEFLC